MVTSVARNNLYPFTSWGRIYSYVRTLVHQTQQRFLEGQCRVEQAVFMPDDVVVLLDGRPTTGYIECGRTTIDSLELTAPDGWIGCEELAQVETNDLVVCRCVGDWESEGLLALKSKSTQELVWLLHLESSEEFVSAEISNNHINAQSGGYPSGWQWWIPIRTPWLLKVEPIKIT
jgi:hypothetical protein